MRSGDGTLLGCAFCEIAAGSEPGEIVYSDPDHIAFLDHRPLFPGHVLLCPVPHHETIEELAAVRVGPLFELGQRLATAVRVAMEAEGTFMAINNRVSQSVPHLHLHVVPRSKGDGLRGFFWPRNPYRDAAHRAEVADRIRAELATPTRG